VARSANAGHQSNQFGSNREQRGFEAAPVDCCNESQLMKRFIVTLSLLITASLSVPEQRLRAALKRLLRNHGLRVAQ